VLLSFFFLSPVGKQKGIVDFARAPTCLLRFLANQMNNPISSFAKLLDDFIFG
jgi:hypothetical protein